MKQGGFGTQTEDELHTVTGKNMYVYLSFLCENDLVILSSWMRSQNATTQMHTG